jgi:upstream activation factor subunit UAF30
VAKEDSVTIETSMSELLTSFSSSIQSLTLALNKLKTDYKTLEKQVLKEARAMDKVNAKRNKNKGSRAPSGFVKPAAISKELAKFLGKPEDTLMSRTDVTKLITAYVKEHKLQDSGNGRRINPDAKLKALLNVKASEEVTYFNLQKYMKSHFVKTA